MLLVGGSACNLIVLLVVADRMILVDRMVLIETRALVDMTTSADRRTSVDRKTSAAGRRTSADRRTSHKVGVGAVTPSSQAPMVQQASRSGQGSAVGSPGTSDIQVPMDGTHT